MKGKPFNFKGDRSSFVQIIEFGGTIAFEGKYRAIAGIIVSDNNR